VARPLVFALDEVMQRPKRRPHWKVYLYDTRSTADTIGSIVRGLTLDSLTGPLDVSDHVAVVDVVENAGDFATSGVPSSKVTISIIDDTPGGSPSRWNPQVSPTTRRRRRVSSGRGTRCAWSKAISTSTRATGRSPSPAGWSVRPASIAAGRWMLGAGQCSRCRRSAARRPS